MVLRAFYQSARGLLRRQEVAKSQANGVKLPHVWRSRAGILDLDINFHMNNASYLYNLELARWELSGANGLLSAVSKNRWMFLVGSQAIRYRHAIAPYEKFQVETRLVAADEKWFFLDQVFKSEDGKKTFASATVRAMIAGKKGAIAPKDVFGYTDVDPESIKQIPHPDEVDSCKCFLAWDNAMHQEHHV